ncbi:MAG: hypothetical protein ACO3F2_03440 [Roseiflexaceae bacterium]
MPELRRCGQTFLLSILPFLGLNTIVSLHIQPLLGWIRPTGHTTLHELMLLGMSMLWAGYGATQLLWPLRRTTSWSMVRIIGGCGLLSLVLVLTYVLGDEIYRCDILREANCD